MDDEARRARAAARRQRMVIQRTRLGHDDAAIEGTPAERVGMVSALTRAAWAMTGQPWPATGVGRTIVRFVPRGAG